ncbi:hypothetical protein bcgnr5379_61090 [Bacillus cereus]
MHASRACLGSLDGDEGSFAALNVTLRFLAISHLQCGCLPLGRRLAMFDRMLEEKANESRLR